MAVTLTPSPSTNNDRRSAVDAARERWRRKLIDLTRRNPLLYYRHQKVGTLDFATAEKSALQALLSGKGVSVRELFSVEQQQAALRAITEIRKRAVANREEKGIETLFLAIGRVTWTPATPGRPPAAPVLLLPIDIVLTPRGTEARLESAGTPRVNAVLLYALAQEHGRTAALELQNDGDDEVESVTGYLKDVIVRLGAIARGIPGLKVDLAIVLGNFAFQKLGIVNDLRQYADQLTGHDIIAAIAGHLETRQRLQRDRIPINVASLDSTPPEQDFLILNADSSQQQVIAAVLAGQSGVIQGPPGTGKSQTIANLIATLAAHGKRVLFVAEKQAALDVVHRRLQEAKLGYLALNLHDGSMAHSRILEQLRRAFTETRRVLPVDSSYVHKLFVKRRRQLNEHVTRLHTPRLPSKRSAYQLYGDVLATPAVLVPQTRWRNHDLLHITFDRAREIRDLLLEAGGFDALFLGRHPSPWAYAHLFTTVAVQDAVALVQHLIRARLPQLISATTKAADVADLPPPTTVAQVLVLLELLPYIAATLNDYAPGLFDEDLKVLVKRLAPAGEGRLTALWYLVINGDYRHAYQSARKHAKQRGIVWPWSIHVALTEAVPYQQQWQETLGDDASVPERAQVEAARAALALADTKEAYQELQWLAALFPEGVLQKLCRTAALEHASFKRLNAFMETLEADQETPYRVPRVLALRASLQQRGATPLVQELRERRPPPEQWVLLFERAWLTSCFEQARRDEPQLINFNSATHEGLVDEFRQADLDRIRLAAERVRRAQTERVRDIRNAHGGQDQLVQQELGKKRGHLPMRKLIAQAGDVLTALCPCWMASPLTVSQFIPGDKRYFDVVIFDEASQVVSEDAVAALLRGSSVVVAGDRHQLPPTRFFAGGEGDIVEEEQGAPEQGFESLLDLMGAFLEPWPLLWHYRSRDEALIAFANQHIYENSLVTFPGPSSSHAVRHVLVPWEASDAEDQEESGAAEIRRAVELILEHAEQRPKESLGVITLGIKHMQRLQTALDNARKDRTDLDDFFVESHKERFFIKNLERVQGDERDAIILSLGSTKNRAGRLNYVVFGPLLRAGGERRLNVAITRARTRMTLVSSFEHSDMPPGKSRALGVELLREYLAYAAANGTLPPTPVERDDALDVFEADVYQTLTARNIPIQARLGASDARIAFAAKHPNRPDEYVLAIETDGSSYHASPTSTDRDRLRQQQLEQLGWVYHRIWSLDWYQRREQTIARVLESYAAAVQAADKRRVSEEPNPTLETVLQIEQEADEDGTEATPVRGARPDIPRRQPITNYVLTQLVALVRWVNSDGVLRTDEEIIEELRQDLGFQRTGPRMRETFQAAITMERRGQQRR